LYGAIQDIIKEKNYSNISFDFFCSLIGSPSPMRDILPEIRLKEKTTDFFKQYDLFLSLHCKQIFPEELVNNCRCVNVHPGLNPYNRGWFPQVFAIMNKLPHGATIHEIDKDLDHGAIIAQKEVKIYSWSTSYSVYSEVQTAEIQLLKENFDDIINNTYHKYYPESEGNINYIKDFKEMLEIKLDERISWAHAIDHLRALSFNGYDNAYFIDEEGNKVYIEVKLKKAD
jgi:methionyl-tRNA formyltransferase